MKKTIVGILVLLFIGASIYLYKTNNSNDEIDRIYEAFMNKFDSLGEVDKQSFYAKTKLIDIEIKDTTNYQYTYLNNYKFKSPWGVGKESETTKDNDLFQHMEFPNGKKILFSCNEETFRESMNNSPQGEGFLEKDKIDEFLIYLGDKADSYYDTYNFLYSTTPEDILESNSPQNAEIIANLLLVKSNISAAFHGEVFKFELENIKGFLGSRIDKNDSFNASFETGNRGLCILAAHKNQNISQDEMEIVLQTFTEK